MGVWKMNNKRIICALIVAAVALSSCSKSANTSSDETETTKSKETAAVTTTEADTTASSDESSQPVVTGNHPSGFILTGVDDYSVAAEDFTNSEVYVRVIDDLKMGDRTPTVLIRAAQTYPEYAEGDCSDNVTKDLVLPTQVDDINVVWASSDESIVGCDGRVTPPHDHSKYVLLTATYEQDGSEVEAAYVVRVARDVFADIGTDKVLPLDGYDELWAFETIGIDTDNWDYPGWFYEYDVLEQLFFFQNNVDELSVYDDSTASVADYFITGDLCETTIETAHESDLLLYSMRKIIKWNDNCEMRYEGVTGDSYTDIYDYRQYYKGVPTSGWAKVIIATYAGFKSVHSWILQIPEGFDEKPAISEDEITGKYNLVDPSLEITEKDGAILLVWRAYSTDSNERVTIDAQTGEEIYRVSTVIVD